MSGDLTNDVYISFEQADDIGITFGASENIGIDFDNSSTPFAANYNVLANKPSIDGTVLIGDKSLPQIGIGTITDQDIDNMLFG